MAHRITRLTDLKDGQHAIVYFPLVAGIVKIEYIQLDNWTIVPKPLNPRPDIEKQYILLVGIKTKRYLNKYSLEYGIWVPDGPCRNKNCGSGIIRQKLTGDYLQCKTCYGGWL